MKKLFIAFHRVRRQRASLSGQNVRREALHKPLADAWPTYSGDYSGRRFSALTQINQGKSRTSPSPGRGASLRAPVQRGRSLPTRPRDHRRGG